MGLLQANDLRIPKPIGGPLPEPPNFATFEEERLHRKLKLAAAFRIFARFGMAEGIAGHITVRDPEFHDRFWVNPYAQHFSSIHPDDLICIDEEAHVYHGTGPVNAAAAAIHCGIHGANPNVVAAAHTHTTYGRAFAARSRLLAPINQESCLFYRDHVLFKGDIVVLAQTEGRRIAAVMGDARSAILLNHGLLDARPPGRFRRLPLHCHGALLPGAAAGRSRREAWRNCPRKMRSPRLNSSARITSSGSASRGCISNCCATRRTCAS